MRLFRRKPKAVRRYHVCGFTDCTNYAQRVYQNGDGEARYRCPTHPLERGALTGAVDVIEVTSFGAPFEMRPIPETM